ncbi:hypothetical protein AB0N07_03310 [Streptomyces sp. NPDC051172]|uniref:hypothetical protein n=1 Tax=Streptomyces sp. NPDC051172 TaxID=3155796 RepID=UPI00341BA043
MSEDDRIEHARELYGGLVDAGLTRYDHAICVDPDQDRAPAVAHRLDELFRARPEYRGVAIRVRGLPQEGPGIGISSHARVRESLGVAGGTSAGYGSAEWGAGDRAGLLGMSTQYRTVVFVCRQCRAGEARAFYDARLHPRCSAGHGLMELVR